MHTKRCLTILSLTLGLAVKLAFLAGMHTVRAAQSAAKHAVCPTGPPPCEFSPFQAGVDAVHKGNAWQCQFMTLNNAQARISQKWNMSLLCLQASNRDGSL